MDANSQSGNNSNGAGSASGGDNNQGQGSGDGTQNQNQNQGGQQQQQQQGQSQNIDLKSLSAEQLDAVFENPNLWKHSRFTELSSKAQELKKLQDQQKADEEKRLTENNEFKTLAETRASDLEKANQTIQNMRIDQVLTNKLVPEGVVDLEAALKLVDRSKITVDDNGNVTGVDDVLSELKKGKAYLFNGNGQNGNQSLGSSSNNQGNQGNGAPAKFKRSQLRDPKFYQANRDAILEAQKNGLIENDL